MPDSQLRFSLWAVQFKREFLRPELSKDEYASLVNNVNDLLNILFPIPRNASQQGIFESIFQAKTFYEADADLQSEISGKNYFEIIGIVKQGLINAARSFINGEITAQEFKDIIVKFCYVSIYKGGDQGSPFTGFLMLEQSELEAIVKILQSPEA